MKHFALIGIIALAGCASTETGVHSYNGSTAEIVLYGDTFAFGSEEQKQAQLSAATVKAKEVCGSDARYLDRRLDHQPQNGLYHVPAKDIAIFKCLG